MDINKDMEAMNESTGHFQQRMKVITKDLEALFIKKKKQKTLRTIFLITMTKVIQNPYGLINWCGLIMFHIAFVLSYAWHFLAWYVLLLDLEDFYAVNGTYEHWDFEIRFIHFYTNIEMMHLTLLVAKDLWNGRQRSLVHMLLRGIPVAWLLCASVYAIHSILFLPGCPFFLSKLKMNNCPFMVYILK